MLEMLHIIFFWEYVFKEKKNNERIHKKNKSRLMMYHDFEKIMIIKLLRKGEKRYGEK